MTTTAPGRDLADELERTSKLTTPEWRQAVIDTPRQHFIPRYYRQTDTGSWETVDTTSDEGMRAVYANTVLVTALARTGTSAAVLSSSTQPGLMTRMLEALDVHDGHKVLEIGTGTGYNAALLSHRLGDDQVFSIDVEPDLVNTARARLAELGHHPTLVSGDGWAGLPQHAPFDRIIGTCAVPRIPCAWVEQTSPGGVILADLKPALGAGGLVRLTRTAADRVEGRFDATYATFMDLRHTAGATKPGHHVSRDHDRAQRRTTSLSPTTPWDALLVWFLASFDLGTNVEYGYTGPDTTTPPTATWLTTADGSWAEITLAADTDGQHTVIEGGPRQLWCILEHAHQQCADLGQPTWDRFGLTVTPQQQTVWLDDPDDGEKWLLSA